MRATTPRVVLLAMLVTACAFLQGTLHLSQRLGDEAHRAQRRLLRLETSATGQGLSGGAKARSIDSLASSSHEPLGLHLHRRSSSTTGVQGSQGVESQALSVDFTEVGNRGNADNDLSHRNEKGNKSGNFLESKADVEVGVSHDAFKDGPHSDKSEERHQANEPPAVDGLSKSPAGKSLDVAFTAYGPPLPNQAETSRGRGGGQGDIQRGNLAPGQQLPGLMDWRRPRSQLDQLGVADSKSSERGKGMWTLSEQAPSTKSPGKVESVTEWVGSREGKQGAQDEQDGANTEREAGGRKKQEIEGPGEDIAGVWKQGVDGKEEGTELVQEEDGVHWEGGEVQQDEGKGQQEGGEGDGVALDLAQDKGAFMAERQVMHEVEPTSSRPVVVKQLSREPQEEDQHHPGIMQPPDGKVASMEELRATGATELATTSLLSGSTLHSKSAGEQQAPDRHADMEQIHVYSPFGQFHGFTLEEGNPAVGDGTCAVPVSQTFPGATSAVTGNPLQWANGAMASGTSNGTENLRPCGPHGFCRKGGCVCVAAYEGERCERPKTFPLHMHSEFDGNVVLGRQHVLESQGVYFRANPKAGKRLAGDGQVRSLFAPLTLSPDVDRLMLSELARGNLMFADGGKADSPTVITPGLLQRLPERDVLEGILFDTCAIVGSSGLNLLREGGAEIDAHDAVFRFNSAPTRPDSELSPQGSSIDWSRHVGRRTTIRMVNTQHITAEEDNEVRLQQLQSKSGLFNYIQHVEQNPSARLFALDTDFTTYVSSNLPVLPTGGFFAIMLALQKCARVDIYGFHWRPGLGIPHHYFNGEVPLSGDSTVHDYGKEIKRVKALAKAGLVNFAQPCASGCEAQMHIPCHTCPPGSTCACDNLFPVPLALPGFCHVAHNYTCFYACPAGVTCQGGHRDSRCPDGFDPVALDLLCATPEQADTSWRNNPPAWARVDFLNSSEGRAVWKAVMMAGPPSTAGESEHSAKIPESVTGDEGPANPLSAGLHAADVQSRLEGAANAEAALGLQQVEELRGMQLEQLVLRGRRVKRRRKAIADVSLTHSAPSRTLGWHANEATTTFEQPGVTFNGVEGAAGPVVAVEEAGADGDATPVTRATASLAGDAAGASAGWDEIRHSFAAVVAVEEASGSGRKVGGEGGIPSGMAASLALRVQSSRPTKEANLGSSGKGLHPQVEDAKDLGPREPVAGAGLDSRSYRTTSVIAHGGREAGSVVAGLVGPAVSSDSDNPDGASHLGDRQRVVAVGDEDKCQNCQSGRSQTRTSVV